MGDYTRLPNMLPRNVVAGCGTSELNVRVSELKKCSSPRKGTLSKVFGSWWAKLLSGLIVAICIAIIFDGTIIWIDAKYGPLPDRALWGDAVAQYELGMASLDGSTLLRDAAVAASSQKSARKALAGANLFLTTEDEANGAKWVHRAAKQGHAGAEFIMAELCAKGRGVPRRVDLAARWLRRASEQGHVEAQHRLAKALQRGAGVPVNVTEAAYWFKMAAGEDHWPSCMAFAECYETGNGVEVDDEEAFKWYKKAADGGLAAAKVAVAARYVHGVGTAKHVPAAYLLLEGAAKQGDTTAHYLLGQLAYHQKLTKERTNKEIALQYYMQAAERGHAWAQSAVGYMYSRGEVGKEGKDHRRAKAWWEKAAAQGLEEAKHNLQCHASLLRDSCSRRASDLWTKNF